MRFLFSNYMIAFYILAAVLIWILSGVLGGNNDVELVEGNEVSVETNLRMIWQWLRQSLKVQMLK